MSSADGGPSNELKEREALGRVIQLEEIAGLEFEHMANFYIKEESDEAESASAQPNAV